MPTQAEIERRIAAMTAESEELAKLVDDRIRQFQSEAVKLEAEMFDLANEQALRLSIDDAGKIKNSASNIAAVSRIDLVFRQLADELNRLMRDFADWLFEITDGVIDIYKAGKFAVGETATLDAKIAQIIGIKDGKLIPGEFLDRLGQSDPVKQRLKDFMLSAISGKIPLADLTGGLRGLIKGTSSANGAMVSYLQQYAYDTFNQVREIQNSAVAERLEMTYFIYQGSLISESRDFCRKRAGKPFSVAETEDWKNDPTLIEPKTKDSYKPLIERGRYRCRHWITYISKEMYDLLKEQQNG